MGYSGTVPSEDSSGQRTRRGNITKTGNTHLRRIAIEAAWSYRLRPGVGPGLRKRQEGVAEEIKEIAWRSQHRLHKRYMGLAAAGKDQRKIITAVGRELLCFIWDRPSWTRDSIQRQLPTDHDYAVSTREYQVINRRSNLPRLLLALSSKKGNNNHKTNPSD